MPAEVSDSWLDRLPPFVSAETVARLFDVPKSRVMNWMRAEDSDLPYAKRPDGQFVTAREHVVKFAEKLYGDMGYRVDHKRSFHDEVHGASESDVLAGDGLDRR